MKKSLIISLFLLFTLILQSCSDDEPEELCTLEFRSIGVTVKGDVLSDFYTIRISNSDTIRPLEGSQDFGEAIWYPIITDRYHSQIKNSTEGFRFIGLINDTIKIDQAYTIEGDECHINRLEGPNEIEL